MPPKYIQFTEPLYNYMLAQRSGADDPVFAALQAETLELGGISMMAISPDQAGFMTLLAAITRTKFAVEVGTFTGSSSLSIARGLEPGGKLICFDQSEKWTSIARRYWAKAGMQDRIELRLGDARETLAAFRPAEPLDFVFIDADKESYDAYYELLLPQVRPGGLLIFDNMLRNGDLLDPAKKNEPANVAIDALNRKLATDARVQSVLISVADGLNLCRKL